MNRASIIRRTALKRTPFRRKVKSGVRIFKDGRVIYQGRAYTAYRMTVYEAQGRCCLDCGKEVAFVDFEIHHLGKGQLGGRGLGGAKRDDRQSIGLCGGPLGCHSKRHSSRHDPSEGQGR